MARRPLSLIDHGRTFVVRGNAKTVLEDGGFRGVYVGTVKGWILDRYRMPDLMAYLDSRDVPYNVTTLDGVA